MTIFMPCPFCGADHPDNPDESPSFPDGQGGWVVRCGDPSCGAEVRDDSPGDALAKWNRRA